TAALAGVLGHAFSPMLKFKGGKAIAVSFGAWSVLTKWEAPTILGVTFTLFSIIKRKKTTVEEDAFRVLIGYLILLFYIIFKAYQREIHLLLFYLGNTLIVIYKHRKDLIRYFAQKTQ
ncbi:MAG: glycerol-3-phosphate acyltransferase, partial [Brevinematia bacterium]